MSFRSAARLAPLAMAIVNLSVYLTEQGNIEEARATAMEALTLARSEGGHTLRTTLQQIARLQALGGSYDSAAQLAGYVDEIERAPREPNDQNVYDSLVKILRSRMDEERRTLLFSIGKRLTSVEAIRLATGGKESP
jgi:hypothetical protein